MDLHDCKDVNERTAVLRRSSRRRGGEEGARNVERELALGQLGALSSSAA